MLCENGGTQFETSPTEVGLNWCFYIQHDKMSL